MSTKAELRTRFLNARREYIKQLPPSSAASFNKNLLKALASESGLWAAYCALPDEADPSEAVRQADWIDWAYPRLSGDSLEFYQPEKDSDFSANQWKILEPIPEKSKKIPQTQLAGFLVPGVAFDQSGQRLGRGAAYYDKALVNSEAKKIGVCFSVQVSQDLLPVQAHDIAMDVIVTEKFILSCSKENRA